MLNLTTLKTPGVYIDEVPKFPPSIAAVETAIPAFVGYTQKADKVQRGDLLNVPTKIGSIAEYEQYFGGGAAPKVDEVLLDDAKNFKSAKVANVFYMFDSLRLFYANGGGDCYIVSTGTYDAAGKTAADFTNANKGITTLEKVDEPTILVFPDNSLLQNGSDFYTVYDAALSQCGKLLDRVGLFHVKEDDPLGAGFRSGTGINNLKYGMAYSPWLNVNFPMSLIYRDIKGKIKAGASSFELGQLTSDTTIQGLVTDLENVMKDVDNIKTNTKAIVDLGGADPGITTVRDRFTKFEADYLGDKVVGKFTPMMNLMFEVARKIDVLVGATPSAVLDANLKTALQNHISTTMKPIFEGLISLDKEVKAKVGASYAIQYSVATAPSASAWAGIFAGVIADPPVASDLIPVSANTNILRMDAALALMRPIFDQINSAWLSGVVGAASESEINKNAGLIDAFPLFKSILSGIQNTSTAVPPVGAVAGIYALVDRTRGVWKAPANVSVSGIIGPKNTFTASELDGLNVDAGSGKSINAIRSFTGKGTLVYGARTLAGNDNEWRYVSVRRFFNMAEESIKKATEQFVFEPNDANTWVKVQAMIENFLNTLWRVGALQGAKPEHAYYAAVGLGKTMTPLDILEGRMIVEIGMAVVRPAEFIILRFSHKLAES